MTGKRDLTANIKRRFDHDAAKQVLKEKYEAKMLFAAFGGMWKAGPDLLCLTKLLGHMPGMVLLDEYGNPCKVVPFELHELAAGRWQEQMNAWHHEFEELQKQR